ncbi:hypothetical protein CK203_064424 [Vitis vinifera]|uniref:Uncharacterized protein n=1 Tax=Vitis vinifera TaxID=29760 RepID=A0A438FQF7_VITVI|nr:hypothetical protein CK203_064424 [Vitis vinifera]
MAEITTFLLIFSYLFMAALIPLSIHSQPTHTITPGQNLTDSERMVSANGVFTLGSSALVNPITNSSGVLTIGDDGRLKIKQSGGLPIVLNTDQAAKHNATATLLDSGNLVLTHMINDNGAFKRRHHEVPAPGAFTLGLDPTVNDSCQVVIWRRGIVLWRSGIWEDKSTHFEDWWNTYNVSFTCAKSNSKFWCVEEESKCGRHHRTAFRFMNKYMKRRAEYSDDDPNLGKAGCDAKCKENCSCIAYASAHNNGTGCHFWLQNSPPVEGAILGLDAFVSDQELNKGPMGHGLSAHEVWRRKATGIVSIHNPWEMTGWQLDIFKMGHLH